MEILGLGCFLAIFVITFYQFLSFLLGSRFTDRLDLLFLSAFGLLAYSFDAFFNFPQDRPEIQSLFAMFLGMSIVVSPLFSKNGTPDPVTNTSENDFKPYSKILLIIFLIICLISSWIFYLNFKSLKIQFILKEEQVLGKSLVNSSFLLENFPAIPNLSSSSDPINGLIAKKLNDEKKYK